MIRPLLEPALVVTGVLVLLALVVLGATRRASDRLAWWRRGAIVLLLGAIALRPGIGSVPRPTQPASAEVLLVVDRTTSMSARDWHGAQPRLAGVREDVSELAEALPGARFTVLTFGLRVRTLLPSTSDTTLVSSVLDALRTEEPFQGRGTRVDRPLDALTEVLEEKRDEHPDRPRYVVMMTDGENTAPGRARSYAPVAPLVDEGIVAGYGTKEGGPMPLPGESPTAWVVDPRTGEPAVSRLHEPTLRTIAEELGLPYLHRRAPGGLAEVTDSWERGETPQDESGAELPAELELVWLLAVPLLLLALVELRTHWRRLWQAFRELR